MYYFVLLLLSNTNLAVANFCDVQYGVQDIVCNCSSLRPNYPIFCPDNTTILYIKNMVIGALQDFAFRRLQNLHYLNFDNCGVTRIERHAFQNLRKLKTLSMAFNPLIRFQSNVFEPLDSLHELWISHKLLSSYPFSGWNDLSEIESVYTYGGPEQGIFSNVFSAMKSLKYFNHFAHCDMIMLQNSTFASFKYTPLRTLKLVCSLRHIEINAFVPLENLTTLLIPYQRFLKLSNLVASLHAFKDREMDMINLSSCFRLYGEFVLTREMMAVIGNICLKSLQFSDNGLRMIDSSGLENMKYSYCLEHITLTRNKFDFHQMWIIALMTLFSHLKTLDIAYIHETNNDNRNWSVYRIPNDKKTALFIGLPASIEFINASYIKKHIGDSPKSITVAGAENLVSLDLSGTSFNDCNYTFNGLQRVKRLYLSKYNCRILNPNLLHSCTGLQQLVMQSSFLNIGLQPDNEGHFLRGLTHLTLVDFSDNKLKSLSIERVLTDQFNSLKVLLLKNNLLKYLPANISWLQQLELLDMRNNKIQYITVDDLSDIESHNHRMHTAKFRLLLDGNPLLCNCDSLAFIKWIFTTDIKLDKGGVYSCLYIDGSMRSTAEIYQHISNLQIRCIPKWLYILVAVSCAAVIICLVIACVIYRYRFYIYLRILNLKERLLVTSTDDDVDVVNKIYDALILYADNQHDGNWVKQTLWPFLVDFKEYRTVLEHEHTECGSVELSNIIQLCKSSNRLILVVSDDFLSSALEEVVCDQIIKEIKEKYIFTLDLRERGYLSNSIGTCMTYSSSCKLSRGDQNVLLEQANYYEESKKNSSISGNASYQSDSSYFNHSFWEKLNEFLQND